MSLPPIYLTRVPTRDGVPGRYDIKAYRSPEDTTPVAIWPWYIRRRPRKNTRRWALNCVSRAIVWIEKGP